MSVFSADIEGGNTLPVIVDGSAVIQPVSGTVTAVQATGTNLHVVTDATSTTAVSGNVTVVQPTGTNLHVVVDSGTITTSSNKATTAAITRVATSTTAATVLTVNANRKKFVIRTETGTHNYVAYGSVATSTNYSYDLGPDATLEETVWTGSVSVIRGSGTGSIQVTDLV